MHLTLYLKSLISQLEHYAKVYIECIGIGRQCIVIFIFHITARVFLI